MRKASPKSRLVNQVYCCHSEVDKKKCSVTCIFFGHFHLGFIVAGGGGGGGGGGLEVPNMHCS